MRTLKFARVLFFATCIIVAVELILTGLSFTSAFGPDTLGSWIMAVPLWGSVAVSILISIGTLIGLLLAIISLIRGETSMAIKTLTYLALPLALAVVGQFLVLPNYESHFTDGLIGIIYFFGVPLRFIISRL
jgi:hypothetical protein